MNDNQTRTLQDVIEGLNNSIGLLESVLDGDDPVEPPAPIVPTLRCGVNIDEASYYSQIIPWSNVARQAKPWHSGTAEVWNDKRALDLNQFGMPSVLEPGQVARTLLHRNGGLYPGGLYGVSPSCIDKEISPRFDAIGLGAGSITAFPSEDGICLEMNTPIPGKANMVCIWRESGIHSQSLLDLLSPFGVLRTMDLQRTNGSPITCLDDYVSYDNWTWDVPGGPPIRALCELCNAANCALWFCVPHQAITREGDIASKIKEHLAPHLPVYVEYSNEVWNGGFGQSKWCIDSAIAAGYSGENDAQRRAHFYSFRSVFAIEVFKRILGSDRVIGVMASQAANAGLSRRLLEYEHAYEVVDALAIAPYFGGELGQPDRIAEMRTWTKNSLIDVLGSESIPAAIKQIEMQEAIADEFGVDLIAYEGGQHLRASSVPANDPINALFDAVNRDPGMRDLYKHYLNEWDRITSRGTFCHFSLCRAPSLYGRWGLVESMLQDPKTAPKYQAVKEWAEQ